MNLWYTNSTTAATPISSAATTGTRASSAFVCCMFLTSCNIANGLRPMGDLVPRIANYFFQFRDVEQRHGFHSACHIQSVHTAPPDACDDPDASVPFIPGGTIPVIVYSARLGALIGLCSPGTHTCHLSFCGRLGTFWWYEHSRKDATVPLAIMANHAKKGRKSAFAKFVRE